MALASGDEAKSAEALLSHWADALKTDGVKLVMFEKTFKLYRAVQAEVEKQVDGGRGSRKWLLGYKP